jgi:hypothetical protein
MLQDLGQALVNDQPLVVDATAPESSACGREKGRHFARHRAALHSKRIGLRHDVVVHIHFANNEIAKFFFK